jgi:cellobionic acid phosphorylase
MREDIGKLTQKVPGWNENGAVYCHAATFYAYGLFSVREKEKGFAALRQLLPGYAGNTLERSGQIPLYIPNFYRGVDAGRKAGLSSHHPNTGTVSWYYRTVVAMLMGVRAEADGLRLDPQLPARWRSARVWRNWRGATFEIEIRQTPGRRKSPSSTRVWLDGQELEGTLVPVQPRGTHHHVRVVVG